MSEQTPLSYEYVSQNLELYIDKAQLDQRIQAMALAINERYAGVEELTILCVLKGSFMFVSDLVKYLKVPCQLEFIRLASYGESMHSSGEVKSVNLTLPNLANKHVLVLEDIIDTGLTLSFLMNYLRNLHHTASLALGVLLDKAECRKREAQEIVCDFVGFQIDNDFVVGYGLDFAGYFRNLPEIYRYIGAEFSDDASS
jgi:hypoxanthine phosphoribosyltransferase